MTNRCKVVQEKLQKNGKQEASNQILSGEGFPDGNAKGEVIKVRRLELDLGKKGLFLSCEPRKIIVAQELLAIDGASFAIRAFLMSENVEHLLPKAILLEKCNVELLNGLVAAESGKPNIVLPIYVWDVRSELLNRIENGETLEIKVKQHKAIIHRLSK
jgi:hypothetical protein